MGLFLQELKASTRLTKQADQLVLSCRALGPGASLTLSGPAWQRKVTWTGQGQTREATAQPWRGQNGAQGFSVALRLPDGNLVTWEEGSAPGLLGTGPITEIRIHDAHAAVSLGLRFKPRPSFLPGGDAPEVEVFVSAA